MTDLFGVTMIKNAYSPFKIAHHQYKIEQLKRGEQTTPLQVQLVPTNICNHNCSFCAYRNTLKHFNREFDPKTMMSYDKILESLDCFCNMGVKAVQITGGGEPLLHPDITSILAEIMALDMDLALVSNGSLLTESICELLGESSWTRISIDAATSETYKKIHNTPEKMHKKTLDNVVKLVRHRRKNIIGIGFVVVPDNYKEIYDAAKMFKDIGVDNIRISVATMSNGKIEFKSVIEQAKELAQRAESLNDDNFHVFNLVNDRIDDMGHKYQDYDYCPLKDLLTFVGADHNVYTCCVLAYTPDGFIGSIKDQSFKDLWESAEKVGMFSNHNPRKNCQNPCINENKNKFANYLLQDDPEHINFI